MNKTKYPRTPHLPWSQGATDDDRILHDLSSFEGKEIVVTEKMDGENTTLGRLPTGELYTHARSLDSRHHPSRDHLKAMWANKGNDLPCGWRICGENLYAQHSITYEDLPDYFLAFSIWNENNYRLNYDEFLDWIELLGLQSVPILARGDFDEGFLWSFAVDTTQSEGYVVTTADGFNFSDFGIYNAKYVRQNHVQTDEHWMNAPMKRNHLIPL